MCISDIEKEGQITGGVYRNYFERKEFITRSPELRRYFIFLSILICFFFPFKHTYEVIFHILPLMFKNLPLYETDNEIALAIGKESHRQHEHIELIASENYTSPAVMAAQGSCLTNKYAE